MLTAKVRAVVTIEFDIGNWQPAASFDSLYAQVSREAETILRNRMKELNMTVSGKTEMKVITFTEQQP